MALKVLFQGDSITDVRRDREVERMMGCGYPLLVSSRLSLDHPGKYEFINRGISGNRVVDLYARWRMDAINLKPDVISILIGVNDVWHDLKGRWNGVEAERFEQIYDMLLSYTEEQLPDTKFIILEPFVLKASATTDDWDYFAKEVPLRAAAAKRVAARHKALFIPLQADLDAACAKAPEDYWLADGVHPNLAGHQLIADKLCEAIRSL